MMSFVNLRRRLFSTWRSARVEVLRSLRLWRDRETRTGVILSLSEESRFSLPYEDKILRLCLRMTLWDRPDRD